MTNAFGPGEATVVIADDDAQVREALAALINGHAVLRVVGVADSGITGAELCALHRPALAVVDAMMPQGGQAVIRAIHAVSATTIIAVYTARSDRRTREHLLAAGAATVKIKGGAGDLADELAALVMEHRARL